MSAHEQRVDRLRHALREEQLDALLVSDGANVTYLSGFRGDSTWLIVGLDHLWLVTDGRYAEQAAAEAPQCEVVRHQVSLPDGTAKLLAQAGAKRTGFEAGGLSFAAHAALVAALDGVETSPRKDLVEKLRMVKDEEEIERMRRAAAAADAAFGSLRAHIGQGQSERGAANFLEYQMGLAGARKPAFDSIVAARERSSLPHAESTDAAIGPGDPVLVDWGALRDLYCSDCTRMLFLGPPDDKWREVYEAVRRGQELAVAAVRDGAALRDVDGAARRHIEEAGYGTAFLHGVGHGVGLRIHEAPALNARAEGALAQGMVVTIEPGIYLPGWGGVRIEDMVVVRKDGAEVLTSAPKDLDAAVLG